MKVEDVLLALDALAPLSFAEAWDNVGLLAGDPAADVTQILVTVDLTPQVAREAASVGATMVVAYHPPIFAGVKRLPWDAPWAQLAARGAAIYSMHTALDVAHGGTNDVLADACGLVERRALRPLALPQDGDLKLVFFVPEDALERVSDAVFAAGAGHIGDYARCSFRTNGTGTFFGEAGASPAVGEAGRLETVTEVRVETVLPRAKMTAVLAALRATHPYEEVAFDLVRLAPRPPEGPPRGLGRIGSIARISRRAFVDGVKRALGVPHLLVAGSIDGDVERVAVAAGSGKSLVGEAVGMLADTFVTGELSHHDALDAVRRGLFVVTTLHSNSERAAVRAFAGHLRRTLAPAGVRVHDAESDHDPFAIV